MKFLFSLGLAVILAVFIGAVLGSAHAPEESTIGCILCETGLEGVLLATQNNATDQEIGQILDSFCNDLPKFLSKPVFIH